MQCNKQFSSVYEHVFSCNVVVLLVLFILSAVFFKIYVVSHLNTAGFSSTTQNYPLAIKIIHSTKDRMD